MIIQCPRCEAKYRAKLAENEALPQHVTCPKCRHRFAPEEAQVSPPPKPGPRVLLIDDARFFRELIQEVLTDSGMSLETATNARDGWKCLQTQSFDLVLIDINLPDVNGLEMVTRIRREEKLKTLKILCISGIYRKDAEALKALRAGADDFISKSFQPDELKARIEKLLGQ